MRSRKVLTAANLGDAVRGCDTYAKTKVIFGPMALGRVRDLSALLHSIYLHSRLLRSAKWRKAPASEQQRKFVAKRRGKISDPEDDSLEALGHLTKGQAANIITRLKHGAKVRQIQALKQHSILTCSHAETI